MYLSIWVVIIAALLLANAWSNNRKLKNQLVAVRCALIIANIVTDLVERTELFSKGKDMCDQAEEGDSKFHSFNKALCQIEIDEPELVAEFLRKFIDGEVDEEVGLYTAPKPERLWWNFVGGEENSNAFLYINSVYGRSSIKEIKRINKRLYSSDFDSPDFL